MSAIVRRNERSWAIDLISKINDIADRSDLKIKKAGGESTIATEHGNRMFPDVLLYGNKEQNDILQGWELKMPDVPIEDDSFIKDAQRKAVALNLNSCLIWNFTYAVLYVKEGDVFVKKKQWNDTYFIKTREDVGKFRDKWEQLLEQIIYELNGYFISGYLRGYSIGENISDITVSLLIERNKSSVARYLKDKASCDACMDAYINCWWAGIRREYENDETDLYEAYAKTIILNWANRIIFAHIIKSRQNGALLIDNLCPATTPRDANKMFEEITRKSDFYNVFSAIKYNEFLPDSTWQDFIEISCFLKNNGIQYIEQVMLQKILENTIATSRREINGQYATPLQLARLLLKITVIDWSDNILDCCCGTGTIPHIAIQIKKERFSPEEAVETVWACDKFQYPLQIANLSMAGSDTVYLANRLFQHDALTLSIGKNIVIINPDTGHSMQLPLPEFGSIVSNLPFVPFETIDNENIFPQTYSLDRRADLYQYIAIKIADMLKPGGRLGIITSNSWLGTEAGAKFVEALSRKYIFKQVHISGNGRWFENADVVATIIILEKKSEFNKAVDTQFWLWKKPLNEISNKKEYENILVNSSLLEKELDASVATLSKYTPKQIEELLNLSVSYNALFYDIGWLLAIKNKIIRINDVFNVIRGSRRGWDALFYPEKGTHNIEDIYLKKVLRNAKGVSHLVTKADGDAFCCSLSIDELKKRGHSGALEWIYRFKDQKNKVGKPLKDVLRSKNMKWYEMRDTEIAEIFTMMNPDQRFFFGKFEFPSFINQRVIGLNHRMKYSDIDLNHALLNSIFTFFSIEASGFGRGLGVLDINKENVSRCYMLNPQLVNDADRQDVIDKFEKLKSREIMKITDELNNPARIGFECAVLRSFGIEKFFNDIRSSLISMVQTRLSVKNK